MSRLRAVGPPTRLKGRGDPEDRRTLRTMMSASLRLTFEDMLFASYAVPPARLRPLVPSTLVLDTIEDSGGKPFALVSAVAFRSRLAEAPFGLPIPLDAPQQNLRTYVKPAGQSVYFIRAELGARPLGMLGEIAIRGGAAAPIAITADYDDATETYRAYALRCASPAGEVALDVEGSGSLSSVGESPPIGFSSWEAAAAFVVDRPVGYFSTTLGGYLRLDVDHLPLRPEVGRLVDGRLRSLEHLGVLTREEARSPHSVFLKRRAEFTAQPPRPVLLPSGLRD